MNLTVNVNIPEKLLSETTAARPLAKAFVTPSDPEASSNLIPLQGPPVAMLLFALTRATSDPSQQQFMTAAQEQNLRANNALYNIFQGSGAGAVSIGQNGIDVFKAFIAANPNYLQTLKAAQDMYLVFKQYIVTAGIWSKSCELKYTQLANIAQTDWISED